MAKSSADDVQLRRVCEAAMSGTKQDILLSIRVFKSRGIGGKSVNSGRGHMTKLRVLALATETKGRRRAAFLRVLKYSNGGVLMPAKLYKLKHLSKVEVTANDPMGCTFMLVFDNLRSRSVAPPQWTMRNVDDRNRLLFCILNTCKDTLGHLPKVVGIDVVEMALWAQESAPAIITKQQGTPQDRPAIIAPVAVDGVRVERELVFPADEEDMSSDDARPYQSYKLTHSDQHGRRRSGRKGTHMKKLRLKLGKGPMLEVTFDSHLEPIGPDKETVANFISYISLLARSKVSILIDKWDSVSERNKEHIWQALLETFDVPSNEELKKKWIQYAGERWRAFKTSLGKYIFGELQGVLPYVEDYTFIDPDTWEAFVASRQTPEFLAKRKKAQEVQSNNKCPHRLSRGGYKSLKRAIVEEKFRARKEASSDPSVVITPPSPPSRHESWKRARITPQGKYVSEEARVIGDKIDSLEEQCSQGSFTPCGRDDILASALGRPEHPGRVRAVGKGIGIRDYFGPSQPRVSQEQLDVIITHVKQQTQQELQKNLEKIKEQMRAEMMMMIGSQGKASCVSEPENNCPKGRYVLEPENHSPKGSCVPESENHSPKGSCAPDTYKEEDEYELYVEDPHNRLVAYGRLHVLGPTIHHRKINEDEVRVVVVRVLVGDARLPCPTEEATTVGETPNQFIAWPKRLVKNVTTKDISQSKQVDPKAMFHPNTDVLKRLWIAAADITQPLRILMEAGIAGVKRDMYINQKDIMELLQNQRIGIYVMQFYNKYLYNVLKISGRDDKYGLMCPLTIQSKHSTKQEIAMYIRTRITERDFDAFLAPYISEDHWQLMVLCPKENVVTWFCSMWKKPKRDLISKIDTAFEAYQITKGTHTHKLKKPTWIYPKCHKQRGDEESGYFVMRLMLEIITLDSFEKILDIEEPYSEEKIDDVRRRWTRCFLEVTFLAN